MDGVLVDFVRGALTPTEFEAFKMSGRGNGSLWGFLGITEEEFWKRTLHPDWWANLPQLPWCFQIIGILNGYFPQADLFILTKPHSEPNCIPGKVRWIEEVLKISGDRVIATPHKSLFAREGSLLVDDTLDHVIHFIDRGGEAIHFPALSNHLHHLSHDPIPHFLETLNFLIHS